MNFPPAYDVELDYLPAPEAAMEASMSTRLDTYYGGAGFSSVFKTLFTAVDKDSSLELDSLAVRDILLLLPVQTA